MSRLPASAEELYELVCALQKEQQLTQVELRAVQRRTEAVQHDLQVQQARGAEEEAAQRESSATLSALAAECRLAEAHARGAARAVSDAADELRAARVAWVLQCRDAAAPSTPASAVPRAHEQTGCPADPLVQATVQDAAALRRLLSSLAVRLTRCLDDDGATAVSDAPVPTAEVAEVTSATQPMAAELPAATPPLRPEPSREAPPPQPLTAAAALLQDSAGSSSKRIGFAPASRFARVTVVPAANVNRSGGWRPDTVYSPVCTGGSTNITEPPLSSVCPRTHRAGGAFTVRLATRSATLVAEAAALGAKRRRAAEAATANSSPPLPTTAAQMDAATAAAVPCAAGAATTECQRTTGRLVASADLLSAGSGSTTRRGGGSGGSRRTVWTWTQGTSPGL
ncbi:hypothetical protein NESM_000771500 [Novymonas esmeraldas]|uniref:Uncharacterized protein n=1 Tax=Novymonas esmeraldas TaxID=1808958 RepID=A0AAW0EZ51_9TRYP